MNTTESLTLCLPRSPICTSVNVPRSPICTVIHTPMVHSYCSMKRLPLFLVRTVCIRYKFAFLEFSIQFTGKMIQRVEHSTYKCRPNSSMPQNNVAHGGFVPGKQRVNLLCPRIIALYLHLHKLEPITLTLINQSDLS